MRFLIVTVSNAPMPPEQAPMLVGAMKQWVNTHRSSGKLEQVWSFAGVAGGGGILDVESHEELDEIMTGFPFANFSKVEVYPLADLDRSLQVFEKMLQQMAPQ
jgi:muconolactone delta-isomerase